MGLSNYTALRLHCFSLILKQYSQDCWQHTNARAESLVLRMSPSALRLPGGHRGRRGSMYPSSALHTDFLHSLSRSLVSSLPTIRKRTSFSSQRSRLLHSDVHQTSRTGLCLPSAHTRHPVTPLPLTLAHSGCISFPTHSRLQFPAIESKDLWAKTNDLLTQILDNADLCISFFKK